MNTELYFIGGFVLKTILYSVLPGAVTFIYTEKIKAKIKGNVDEKIENIKKYILLKFLNFKLN